MSVTPKHSPAKLHHVDSVASGAGPEAEHAMMKYLMMLMMLFSLAAVNTGCEAEADDDGGRLEVDVDD